MRRVNNISFHAVDQRQDVEYLDIEPCLQRLLVRWQVRAFQKQRPHPAGGAQAEKYADLAYTHDRYNAKALVNKGNCLLLRGELDMAKQVCWG